MRLQTIRIEKLFGVFDHVIQLNMDDRITIIYGPNGYGKTSILRLISDIFGARHTAMRELPFETIVLDFDDDSTLVVRKKDSSADELGKQVVYECPPHQPFTLAEKSSRDVELSAIKNTFRGCLVSDTIGGFTVLLMNFSASTNFSIDSDKTFQIISLANIFLTGSTIFGTH